MNIMKIFFLIYQIMRFLLLKNILNLVKKMLSIFLKIHSIFIDYNRTDILNSTKKWLYSGIYIIFFIFFKKIYLKDNLAYYNNINIIKNIAIPIDINIIFLGFDGNGNKGIF